jgi:hypothetical protein
MTAALNSTDTAFPAGGTRLESMIRRLTAQRDILDLVCATALPEGPVLELGLGNGRTYNHLRARLPDRRIVAFDRALAAHASSIPGGDDLVLGEIRETAEDFADGQAALVHVDIGTGYPDKDARTLEWLPGLMVRLLRARGIAVSGLPLVDPALAPLPIPASVPQDRYYLYRRLDLNDVAGPEPRP